MQTEPHRRWVGPWIVAVLGILASIAAWRGLVVAEDRELHGYFELEASERSAAIEHALGDALLTVESIGAMVRYSGEGTPSGFTDIARELVARQPGLRALSWNPRVADADRLVYETATGRPITEWADGSPPRPAARRPTYDVVDRIVPQEGNESALGFDVASETLRRAAIDRAAATGEISMTASLALVQGDPATHAFLAFYPVRAVDAESTPESPLRGFVAGMFSVGDLVEQVRDGIEDEAALSIVDLDGDPAEEIHFCPAAPAYAGPVAAPADPFRTEFSSFAVERILSVGGRRWVLRFQPTSAAVAMRRTSAPARMLALGLVSTGILSTLLFTLVGRQRVVRTLVSERTAELEDARGWLEERVAVRTADLAHSNRELAREIAQRESAESALRASEERLRLTLDAVSDGGWDWNFPEQRLVLSDSWYASVGREPGSIETYEDLATELIHPDDLSLWREALRSHLNGKTPLYECTLRMKTGSGEWRWFRDRAAVVAWDPEGRPLRMLGVHTDVTEQQRVEEEQRLFAEKVQQAQKLESLGVLAGGIAHDFNNLLAGILGNADLACLKLGPEAACQDELEEVKLAARRAAELTRQLLAYAGKARFAVEEIDLSDLATEMVQLLRVSISQGAEVHSDLQADLPSIQGDPVQIRQVVMNLITNASDAIASGPGVIVLRTGLASDSEVEARATGPDHKGRSVFIEVSDDGCGMDEATRERIFDPFFSTKFQGRGLGLAAAQGIVHAHGGSIQIESQEGLGTTFRVIFPSTRDSEASPVSEARPIPGRAEGTILVVDDEPTVLGFAERTLTHAGFETLTARSGPEGVRVFQDHVQAIDVVLLDLTMPVLSGREVMATLRQIRPGVRILASSGYTEEDSFEEFGAEQPDGFLQKPYLAGELLEALAKLLD